MARFDKSSTKRPKQNAAVAAPEAVLPRKKPPKKKGRTIEDTMFFPRLRQHAKWMFVFLAVVFGLGFVGFGVGAGGVGVGDLFKGGKGGGVPHRVSSAQKKADENPKSAQAWHDLSTALQTDGQTEGGRSAPSNRPPSRSTRRILTSSVSLPGSTSPRPASRAGRPSSHSSRPRTPRPINTFPVSSSSRTSLCSTTRSAARSTSR